MKGALWSSITGNCGHVLSVMNLKFSEMRSWRIERGTAYIEFHPSVLWWYHHNIYIFTKPYLQQKRQRYTVLDTSVDLTVTDFCDLLSSLDIWTECPEVVAQGGFVDIDNDSDAADSALLATLEPNVSHLVKLLFFILDSFSDESYSKHDMFEIEECCSYICSTKPTWNNFLSKFQAQNSFYI